jgi:arsenate reductase
MQSRANPFIEQHPILLNRPIVVPPEGMRLCRPFGAAQDMLPAPQQRPRIKEDGQIVFGESASHRHNASRP